MYTLSLHDALPIFPELGARGLESLEHAAGGRRLEPFDEARRLDLERRIGLGRRRLDRTVDDWLGLRLRSPLGRWCGARTPEGGRLPYRRGIHVEEYQARCLPLGRLRPVVAGLGLPGPGPRRRRAARAAVPVRGPAEG